MPPGFGAWISNYIHYSNWHWHGLMIMSLCFAWMWLYIHATNSMLVQQNSVIKTCKRSTNHPWSWQHDKLLPCNMLCYEQTWWAWKLWGWRNIKLLCQQTFLIKSTLENMIHELFTWWIMMMEMLFGVDPMIICISTYDIEYIYILTHWPHDNMHDINIWYNIYLYIYSYINSLRPDQILIKKILAIFLPLRKLRSSQTLACFFRD